jgi:3-(3-hydroxy-phenyl)propionate hydroxylase
MPRLAELAAALPVPTDVLVTDTYPGATPHTVLLVRPDGHLLGTTPGLHPETLHALTAPLSPQPGLEQEAKG